MVVTGNDLNMAFYALSGPSRHATSLRVDTDCSLTKIEKKKIRCTSELPEDLRNPAFRKIYKVESMYIFSYSID